MIDLETKFSQLIRYASVSKAHDDSKSFPVAQINYLGKTSDAYELYPYGLCAVAPVGSLAVLLNVQGQEENKAFIATEVHKRFNGLKEGEVAVGNFLTGAFIKFLQNGDIQVYSPGNITAQAVGDITASSTNATLNASGNLNATVGGTASVNATSVSVTAPTITLTGNVTITGSLSAGGGAMVASAGGMALTGALTSNGKNISDTHVHSGVTTGPSNTGGVV